ncbi:MAG: hypothetical protein GEV11_22950 [Streptosporangiales bacterium]|nr:hypothetical protein [Streptosporangiales bacterium]
MRTWALIVIGLLLLLVGAVWTLQGVNVLGGSPMSGASQWAVIGAVLVVVGVYLGYLGVRNLRAGTKTKP